LEGREKAVVGLVLLVVVVVAAYNLVNYFSDRREEAAAQAFGAVLKDVERPVQGEGAANPSISSDQPPFKTQKEKSEATLKAMGDFREHHKGTRAALTAELESGRAAFNLGDYDRAVAAYSDFAQYAPVEDPLRVDAFEGMGYAYEAKNQLDQAIEAFEQMNKSNRTGYMNGMGLYHRARILLLQGKKEEAAKAFAEVSGVAPNTPAAKMATERMSLLASQGVTVPPPAVPAADAG
jgi:tetratricopeptide (TPR) repeat protein